MSGRCSEKKRRRDVEKPRSSSVESTGAGFGKMALPESLALSSPVSSVLVVLHRSAGLEKVEER